MTQTALHGADLLHTGHVDDEHRPSRLDGLVRRFSRPVQVLRAVPHLGTWTGVGTTAAGLVLLVIAWGRTAALTNVALQIPYVVSAGFTGLGLVAVGLTVVSISAKREDSRERTRQLTELRELMTELRRLAEDEQP